MKLTTLGTHEIIWKMDFSPLLKLPLSLPVTCVEAEKQIVAVTGFERRTQQRVEVLLINLSLRDAMADLWNPSSLRPLEGLRFRKIMGWPGASEDVLSWPLRLQNFFDSRDIPVKSLRPLNYLREWESELNETLLALSPSSSQVREILDLLSDLKLGGKSWSQVSPQNTSPQMSANQWLQSLRNLRTPLATSRDGVTSQLLQKLPWPKGTSAKWDRQGDQTGITIQSRVTSSIEWSRLKEALGRLEISASLWK